MVMLSSHIVYCNGVQHHLHSGFLRILNRYSMYLFAFYSFVRNIEALWIRCSVKGPIDGCYNGKCTGKRTLLDALSVFFDVSSLSLRVYEDAAYLTLDMMLPSYADCHGSMSITDETNSLRSRDIQATSKRCADYQVQCGHTTVIA